MGEAFIIRRGGSAKVELKSIEVTTPPTKTTYFPGETFDPTGMVVMADLGGVSIAVGGYTVSPTVMAAGVTSVTITYEFAGVTKTTSQAVTFVTPSATLANNSWETIGLVADAGMADAFWNVGDAKAETLNGENHEFVIIGFNHDNLDAGDAKRGTSYNGGSNKAAITFQMRHCLNTAYYMNSTGTNVGGWGSSYMRGTIMPLVKGYMSASLKAALRQVTKQTSEGNAQATVNSMADELFLLSEIEVQGVVKNSAVGEGSQYAYYSAGNTKAKNVGGSVNLWWLRSPSVGGTSSFCRVASDGSAGSTNASSPRGVAVGFCV